MISIIICSRTREISHKFIQNIEVTIGCEYELILIDNSENKYSIFEAYNHGISKSNGNIWCFIHDDIVFHTINWGRILLEIFERDKKIGLIGVAGAKLKTKMPSGWWDCSDDNLHVNILQHSLKNNVNFFTHNKRGLDTDEIQEVAVIDGVFMAARANKEILFDEDFKGYHQYDLMLSLKYNLIKSKVVVTPRIIIEHFSIGTINKEWYISALKFYKEYNSKLPLFVVKKVTKNDIKKQEVQNCISLCNGLLHNNMKKEAFKFWLKLLLLKPLSKYHFTFLTQFLF